MKGTLNPVLHELAGWLKLVGMRDRLRCPYCKSVGTWKPHGGWFDGIDIRKVRRWMCKWCGYYVGPEETHEVLADPVAGCWMLRADASPESTTPAVEVARSSYPSMWPWSG